MAYESIASILGAEGERKTRRARRSYERTAARRKRQERGRTRRRRARQRRELQRLAQEVIPTLERRQARLSVPSSEVAGLLGESPEIRRQRRLSEVESNLEAALVKRNVLQRRAGRRRARRIEPISPAEVALAVGSALPPVRAGVGIAAGARALLAAGGKKAATEAAEQTARTGLRATAARTAAAARAARQAPTRAGQRIGARQAARRATKRGVKRRVLRQGPKGGKAAPVGAGGLTAAAAAGAPIAAGPGSEPEALNVARAPFELGRAFAERPGATASSSYRSLRDTLLGLPAATYEIGAGVVEGVQGDTERLSKLADQISADLKRRYGPLVSGDTSEFRKRVQEESGVTPFALDALIVAPPVSRGAGALARAGGLGKTAERVATEPRAGLRTAANVVREQDVSRGLIGAAAQKALDRRRRRAGEKRQARAEKRPDRDERRAIEAGEGEVVPLSARRAGKLLTRDVAAGKGRAFIQMTEEQAREIARGARKEVAELSGPERRGLTHALRFGIRDPKTAKAILELRLEQIRKNREAVGEMGRYNQAKTIQRLIDEADEVFTPKLARVADSLRRREKRLVVGSPLRGERRLRDPALASEQALIRRYTQQGELLGITHRTQGRIDAAEEKVARAEARMEKLREREDPPDPWPAMERAEVKLMEAKRERAALAGGPETTEQFVARIRTEAKKRGLSEAGYVASELPRGTRFAEFAVGGRRASHQTKGYKGSLFRVGRESDAPDVVTRGLARNIKRRHNWSLVADTFDRHVFKWGRNKSIPDILRELDNRGIAESRVAFWNPGIYRREVEKAMRGDSDEVPGSTDLVDNPAIEAALARAKGEGVDPADFQKSKGWSVVPREVMDEMEASIKASGGAAGRTLDIATQKSARYLLALNPPWLGFQVISNATLAGIAGAGPLTMVKSQLWWRSLSDTQRREIAPYLGVGHFQSDIRQTKYGASMADLPYGARHLGEVLRTMKETRFGQSLGRKNPLDALFRVDNAQNNFFRRAVLYKSLNRDLYKRMNENVGKMAATQERIANIFKLDPDKQLRALARDPLLLEKHTKHVADYLGDYVQYTAKERRFFKRNVMFYGYLRFSLRFAFYTMPVKHPVMTGLMGNLARLKTDEIRELIGTDMPWAIGQFYFDKGKMVMDLSRANPVLNALTEASGVRTAFGIFPPYYGMLASQVFLSDPFTGKDFLVKGEPTPREYVDVGAEQRARIAAHQGLSLFFPYRFAEELAEKDQPHGADTLVFDRRPTKYAPGGEAAQSAAQRKREAERRGILSRAVEEATTIGPSERIIDPARYIERARREEERALEERERSTTGGGWSSSGWGGGGW